MESELLSLKHSASVAECSLLTLNDLLEKTMAKKFDFVVFSHLRWDFVLQRPQHLMSRFAKGHRVVSHRRTGPR